MRGGDLDVVSDPDAEFAVGARPGLGSAVLGRHVDGEYVHHQLRCRVGAFQHVERPQMADIGVHRLTLVTGQGGVAAVHDVLDPGPNTAAVIEMTNGLSRTSANR